MLLLDTNVVSELRKARIGKAHPSFAAWADMTKATELFISVITISAIGIGVLLASRRDPKQGAMFAPWLGTLVLAAFTGLILLIDLAIARRAADLHVPDPQPINDALIGATALVRGMTVVTRNESDFAAIGVALINPCNQPRARR